MHFFIFSNRTIMKKRLLFSLLAIVLAGFWLGGVSMAATVACDTNPEAKIGETCYDTLTAAITAAANNDTIVLMKSLEWSDIDFYGNSSPLIWKTLIIDLNWYNIDQLYMELNGTTLSIIGNWLVESQDGWMLFPMKSNSKLTIWWNVSILSHKAVASLAANTQDGDSSEITIEAWAYVEWLWIYINWNSEGSTTLNLKESAILTWWWIYVFWVDNNDPTNNQISKNVILNILWEIYSLWTQSNGDYDFWISINWNIRNTWSSPVVNINNWAKVYWSAAWIYQAWYSVINISEWAEIKGIHESAIETRAWELTINWWSFISNWDPSSVVWNGNWTTTVWAALVVSQHTTRQPINVTVAWWEFNGINAIHITNPQENDIYEDWHKVEVVVNWWNFNGGIISENQKDGADPITKFIEWWKFSAELDTTYIKDWYEAKNIDENPYFYEVGIKTYTITWNFKTAAWADTSDTTEVNNWETPTHAEDGYTLSNREYTFSAWDPTVVTATADATYKATYNTWSCAAWYAEISGACVNTQMVECIMPSPTITNATYTTTTEITYDGATWSATWECTFTCNAWYRLSNWQCVKKSNSSSSSSSSSNKTWDTTTWNTATWTENTGADAPTVDPQAVASNGYTNEMNEAYEFAFANGITTMKTIDDAEMFDWLTRIAMAKMLSQYAINVLGKSPADVEVPNFVDVTSELDAEYANGVTLAYKLGIMWINMPDNKFLPYETVTRAQFGTALSRLLFGLTDGEEAYYTTHLAKLKEAWIITNDDPTLEELRGYVMLMLMRSSK